MNVLIIVLVSIIIAISLSLLLLFEDIKNDEMLNLNLYTINELRRMLINKILFYFSLSICLFVFYISILNIIKIITQQ